MRLLFLLVLVVVGSCARPEPQCPGEAWAYYDGELDGRSIVSGCMTPQIVADRGQDLGGVRGVSSLFAFWSMPQWPSTPPACFTALNFVNIDLVTGASGAIEQTPFPSREGERPIVYVPLSATLEATCIGAPTETQLLSGRWHVIQGGDLGDVVQVEARDVVFAPINGSSFRIHRMVWRVRLGPPRTADAGR